ncbi:MAG: S46 family peptidase [Bacteroidales bacterium]|nr:S46 family peptidase [Bacteroidales bacterium]MBN2756508.1 S46 family peptidase [Bacteroidales bacterium]
MELFKKHNLLILIVLFLAININANAQRSIYEPIDYKNVKSSFEDFGSMWTFDAVPVQKYEKKYGFKPDKKWLDNVQKSALQFGGGCSASFVSEDGLIMTNHHCIRGLLKEIQQNGENLMRDGYYAKTLEEERVFPGLFVDQLISITDVTKEIIDELNKGKNDEEKLNFKNNKIKELIDKYQKNSELTCKVVSLYNGGKYSLYSYKRYNDIRLVMAPDVQIAATGWDWDNFTYPRYELDFAFLRAYDENQKPVKVKNFFTWSKKGANPGEAIFIIGRPGNTDRLLSTRELEYYRDIRHSMILHRLNEAYQAYFNFYINNPERKDELLGQLLSVANGRKVYAGLVMSLNDKYIMTKKYDFENNLKEKVKANADLQKKYGNLWNDISNIFTELDKFEKEVLTIAFSEYYASDYQITAKNIIFYAKKMQFPEDKRSNFYKKDEIDKTRANVYKELIDKDLQNDLLIAHANFLSKVDGGKTSYIKDLYGGKTNKEALDYFMKNSKIWDEKFVEELLKKGANDILKSDDPMIKFYIKSQEKMKEFAEKRKELYNNLEILNQKLGRLIFEIYGEQIPPDATSTLRISDGVIKDYEYNGTIAPGKTTFYGLWDRYYSFGQKDYPWGLHERWKKVPEALDLSIPIGFASTNDMVGGNSGSAVINKNAEIIGLIHDGNLESIAGGFIFLEENNRAVATDSWGLMEALKLIYKTDRLVDEILKSKIEN